MRSVIRTLHDQLQAKEFSCTELTNRYLAALEQDNKALNAVIA